jgi:hypothetical protein
LDQVPGDKLVPTHLPGRRHAVCFEKGTAAGAEIQALDLLGQSGRSQVGGWLDRLRLSTQQMISLFDPFNLKNTVESMRRRKGANDATTSAAGYH